jgi:hypothetical protein
MYPVFKNTHFGVFLSKKLFLRFWKLHAKQSLGKV